MMKSRVRLYLLVMLISILSGGGYLLSHHSFISEYTTVAQTLPPRPIYISDLFKFRDEKTAKLVRLHVSRGIPSVRQRNSILISIDSNPYQRFVYRAIDFRNSMCQDRLEQPKPGTVRFYKEGEKPYQPCDEIEQDWENEQVDGKKIEEFFQYIPEWVNRWETFNPLKRLQKDVLLDFCGAWKMGDYYATGLGVWLQYSQPEEGPRHRPYWAYINCTFQNANPERVRKFDKAYTDLLQKVKQLFPQTEERVAEIQAVISELLKGT